MMRLLLTAALAITLTATAQGPAAMQSDQIDHVGKLSFMVGTWKGSGWMMLGPGHRAEFTQTEIVTRKLNGALLTIDGDGRDAADPSRHIHDAFAVISYNATTGYHFMPFSGGNTLDVTPILGDKTFQWGFDAPYGKTRFILDFSKPDTWHETGELSRDSGASWTKNFEMTLTRSQ